MSKRFRPVSAALVVTLLGASLGVTGCGQYSFNSLKAKKAYREANELYKASKWREAAERYEVASVADPTLPGVFFFLGNSYDNMYRPSRQDEAENQRVLQEAIKNYRKAADVDPEPIMRQRAMEYLVAAYGPEKLNNPSEAEPVVKRMIEMNQSDENNYFALSKIYEDAGRYEDAEAALLKAVDLKPNEPRVYTSLSGFYNRQGNFEKTIGALEKAADLNPQDPQGFFMVSTYYWEKAQKDHTLPPKVKKDYIMRGISYTDRALALNQDYMEALTYKNILLRMQANTETDRVKQQELLKQADELRNKAIELGKKKATTGGDAPAKK